MKQGMEWQVSNLELSKKLRDLGVPQESLFLWAGNGIDFNVGSFDTAGSWRCTQEYSAFTCSEIGEMLRPHYFQSAIALNQQFYCWRDDESATDWTRVTRSDTEANARAKMLVYLIEQGIIKP